MQRNTEGRRMRILVRIRYCPPRVFSSPCSVQENFHSRPHPARRSWVTLPAPLAPSSFHISISDCFDTFQKLGRDPRNPGVGRTLCASTCRVSLPPLVDFDLSGSVPRRRGLWSAGFENLATRKDYYFIKEDFNFFEKWKLSSYLRANDEGVVTLDVLGTVSAFDAE